MADFNTQVIEEFRSNDGQVGGAFENASLLLLHHTGARSGQERVTPLVYLNDGDRYVVFASKAGAPTHPAWYHNLLAHPETTIEVGHDTIAVNAHEATGAERDRLYEAQVERSPQFGDYQEKAGDRVIPVIVLEPRRDA
ncbi:MAG TPA: nitroreductase family deazaflavin-dependent oxidoreductase [Solirubrobacteraceae bacterium]|nr:nitroreductase family deazaflavin-dependent oxidoreductase [Solirubrobacteraceae bacterium]